MIRAEDVADLREGDVVEFRIDDWPQSHAIRATLQINDLGALVVPIPGDSQGGYWIRTPGGQAFDGENRTLTVVSRAPRPLYVNHDRTEAVVDDIVNYGVGYNGRAVGPFMYTATERWAGSPQDGRMTRWVGLPGGHPDTGPIYNAGKLRLLVDGTTGQVVP